MKVIDHLSAVSRIKRFSLSAVIASGALFGAVDASAHGYVSSPKSRVIMCKENGIENPTLPACIAAKNAGNVGFYSPQSIAIGGVKDNHAAVIPDGKICSAGVGGYAGLDLARTDWPVTQVQAGPREFVWTNTAQHRTMYFRYYITKQGYNPANPLKWSDLEQIHQSAPTGQEATSRHTVNLPARTGRHVVYSIWQRDYADAPEGFYQCIDVQYGGSSSSVAPPSSSSVPSSVSSSSSSSITSDTCAGLPTWDPAVVYNKPNQVKYNSKRYQANYWTQGNNPELTSGQYNYWLDLGTCNGSGSSVSSVAPPSSSSVPSSAAPSSSSSSVSAGNCTSPAYVNGSTYATNALVRNVGNEYRCTVGGWCTVGGPYEPGVGWAWTNAWTLVRSCN
ncbi:lytic polysaccharide monooxygenase auxiliary activity family 9 protein [Cellvibrio sp. NN19]|uniref:lytic polysaccharide monooxygenase auxiliary activity family 9 protein n=1 Tax=Cellvibrio chitinivorans TaxID=3102792 RepID=UPI002B40805B|nr:lytic polysaccharide monooxygenase [Cellvibrio sp. NN19]WQA41848.1 lytic polysaccaride monooxygenase LPMO10A [Cellvibrio sp. NN19]